MMMMMIAAATEGTIHEISYLRCVSPHIRLAGITSFTPLASVGDGCNPYPHFTDEKARRLWEAQ